MRVLFVTPEAYPLIKTGGLADVGGALPAALAEIGVEPRLLVPGYPEAMARAEDPAEAANLGDPLGAGEARLIEARMPGSGVPVWLIDCPRLYDRPGGPYQDQDGNDWPDNAWRFALLNWVAAGLCRGDSPLSWRPDVLHANDWQAGLAAAYLRDWKQTGVGTVFTIHNLAYQGLFPAETLPTVRLPWSMFGIDGLEYYGQMSFLKAGIFYSDRITTVSPTYAREIQTSAQGCGLEGLLAKRAPDLKGVLNGADYGVWNPATDEHLHQPYRTADLAAKAANKQALQQELGLPADPAAPLLVIISRLNHHKGMDLVLAALPALLGMGAQLAVLGTGERGLEEGFSAVARRRPDKVAAVIGYSEPLAHRLQAGGDMLLMPSRSEPCGLTQIYAMRYGTVPVVHATGGLADTVNDCAYDTLMSGTATGFVFHHANADALHTCLERAIAAYRKPEQWGRIRANCVRQDFGWRRSAERYRALYETLLPT